MAASPGSESTTVPTGDFALSLDPPMCAGGASVWSRISVDSGSAWIHRSARALCAIATCRRFVINTNSPSPVCDQGKVADDVDQQCPRSARACAFLTASLALAMRGLQNES